MASGNWIGLDEAIRRIEGYAVKADVAARTAVSKGAHVVEKNTKAQFEGAHAKGQPHVGGDHPNVVTGTLRRSVKAETVRRLGFGSYEARVGPTVIYGRRVELGYAGGSGPGHQMTLDFPYLEPGVEASRGELGDIGIEAWSSIRR